MSECTAEEEELLDIDCRFFIGSCIAFIEIIFRWLHDIVKWSIMRLTTRSEDLGERCIPTEL